MSGKRGRRKVSPTTQAMFDALCDGQWHSSEEIHEIGFRACLEGERESAIKRGRGLRKKSTLTEDDLARAGAKSITTNNLRIAARDRKITYTADRVRVRMYKRIAQEWRRQRSQEMSAANKAASTGERPKPRQHFGEEQVFGGWLEFDAWAQAPLESRDIAYVRPNTTLDTTSLQAAFPTYRVKTDPDGLVSVSAPAGDPVKENVTQWLTDNEVYHEGVRDARNVRRRNISDLPPAFLESLVGTYTRYAIGRVYERHAGSLQRLVGSADDVSGEVGLWVMECVADFNADHGVPFGAWLTRRLANQVMDLNRASYGRTAADAEMRRARAIEAFEAEHGRMPTRAELRDLLGYSEKDMRRKERDLAHLRGLRSSATLDTGPDEAEIPVPDIAADPEGESLNLEMSQTVSRALLSSTGHWDSNVGRPVAERTTGFLISYLTNWDEWTKGDLMDVSNKTNRQLGEELTTVDRLMAEQLEHLRADRPGRPRATGEVASA